MRDAAQSADSQLLRLILMLHQLPVMSLLRMRPEPFMGKRRKRIKRQVEHFEASLLSFDEALNQLGFVNWAAINDQKDGFSARIIKRLKNPRKTSGLTDPSCDMKRKLPRWLFPAVMLHGKRHPVTSTTALLPFGAHVVSVW